jgi:5'-phosphate synthase pdxT subunit
MGAAEEARAGAASLAGGGAGPVGVLAIQGSFDLHLRALGRLGVTGRRVRKPRDLAGLKALILPGGESTVMSLLARRSGLFEPLRELAAGGMPMLGTCAGAILLGRGEGPPPRLEAAPVRLLRNAYGSQVDSFTAELDLEPLSGPFHGVFIRAPIIAEVDDPGGAAGERPEVLGAHGGHPVLVRAGRLLLATFHPELTDDLRLHQYFLAMSS